MTKERELPSTPRYEGELPPRFVGFLVGHFLKHKIFTDVIEAQALARTITEAWNASVRRTEK